MRMLVIGWDVARDAPVLLIQESGPARRVVALDTALIALADDEAAITETEISCFRAELDTITPDDFDSA